MSKRVNTSTREDAHEIVEIDDATHKRIQARVFRKFKRAFAQLAAYDRGEYMIPTSAMSRRIRK
jgi:hypothetical protein